MDNRVCILQLGFQCPDPTCKLAKHNCIKCAYELIRERFNDLSSDLESNEKREEGSPEELLSTADTDAETEIYDLVDAILDAGEASFIFKGMQIEVEDIEDCDS